MTRTLLQCILLVYLSGLVITEGQTKELRVVHKLVGGHLMLSRDDDVELITSGAGEGKGSKKKSDKEEKKTLAQQVADGKYALIQSELFSKPIKKPGLLSYRENSEVPHDTITNLGGLNKSDIWLSENHLLVIKGGSFPPHSSQNLETDIWPSIDDYKAPDRQVKIPAHPKVPPPFPVQLTDHGPLLLLGTNASKTLNGTFQPPIHPLYPEENYVAGGVPSGYADRYPTNTSSGETPFAVPPFSRPGLDYYDSAKERPINGSLPFFPFVGPGDIPPLDNVTYDEDDPSIYYPPPYSFYYRQDNSTQIPPGPLVPGIVLPPPPNFFASLEENGEVPMGNYMKTDLLITTTYKPNITHRLQSVHKASSTLGKSATSKLPTSEVTTRVSFPPNSITPTTTPLYKKPPTASNTINKYPTITILKAITTVPEVIQTDGRSSKMPKLPQTTSRSKTIVTTTRVPLKTFYTSTHFEPVPAKKSKQFAQEVVANTPKTSPRPVSQYYFYNENVINTTPSLYKIPQKYNIPEYYVPAKQVDIVIKEQSPREDNFQYYYVNNNHKPQLSQQSDTFSIHIAHLKDQIHSYESALRNNDDHNRRPVYKPIAKPIYQYSFESANYQNQRNQYLPSEYFIKRDPVRHYDVEIQEAIEVTPPPSIYETTQKDNYYYRELVTENPRKHEGEISASHSKPISEFSFQVTPNPIFQQLYTKHDEPYIDDVTKEYFTVFGKKIPTATTPIPAYSSRNYLGSRIDKKPENRPISLERDTLINYLKLNPKINQHAEFVDDIRYNSNKMQNHPYERYPFSNENVQNDKSYISYRLPGDEGTHFYFITPKLSQNREQNASIYYS